jgi:predicted Zn-dependent protease
MPVEVGLMADNLLEVLRRARGIDAWKIVERQGERRELYLIGHRVDMRRAATVRRVVLTVFRDFQRDDQRLRGSATLRLPAGCLKGELARLVDQGAGAARWAENPYYPLVQPGTEEPVPPASAYAAHSVDLDRSLEPLAEELFAAEKEAAGARLNSAELFAENVQTRIRNSEGLEVQFPSFHGSGELVVEAQGPAGEVELFQELSFAEARAELVGEEARRLLELCRDRAQASPTPPLGSSPLLLAGEAVPHFFDYYTFHAAAESVYARLARFSVGQSVQGERVRGDLLTLSLEPYLAHSTSSAPWDADGFPLRPVPLVEGGQLLRHWGPLRYCHYLGIPPTGALPNLRVLPGARSLAELRGGCLEAVSFSDFHLDAVTGDFGGELRLAYLVGGDGSRKPVTGGSVSGRIGELEGIRFSAETQAWPGYLGPLGLRLEPSAVTGAQ